MRDPALSCFHIGPLTYRALKCDSGLIEAGNALSHLLVELEGHLVAGVRVRLLLQHAQADANAVAVATEGEALQRLRRVIAPLHQAPKVLHMRAHAHITLNTHNNNENSRSACLDPSCNGASG